MLEPINELAVLVSAILALAIGSIWYSPLLFGAHWMRAVGLTEKDLEDSKDKMTKMIVLAVIANLVALYLIAQFLVLADGTFASVGILGLFLSLFYGSFLANAVIWEQRPLSYLLINFGYALIVIFVGIAVIGFWPW